MAFSLPPRALRHFPSWAARPWTAVQACPGVDSRQLRRSGNARTGASTTVVPSGRPCSTKTRRSQARVAASAFQPEAPQLERREWSVDLGERRSPERADVTTSTSKGIFRFGHKAAGQRDIERAVERDRVHGFQPVVVRQVPFRPDRFGVSRSRFAHSRRHGESIAGLPACRLPGIRVRHSAPGRA